MPAVLTLDSVRKSVELGNESKTLCEDVRIEAKHGDE